MVDISDIEFKGYEVQPGGSRAARFVTYVSFVLFDSVKINGAKIVMVGPADDLTRRLAMPSRPAYVHCTACGDKCFTGGARYCGFCKAALPPPPPDQPRYFDSVFPINQAIRDAIEATIFDAWDEFVADRAGGHGLSSRVRQLLRSEA